MDFSIHMTVVVDGLVFQREEHVTRSLLKLRKELEVALERYKVWAKETYGEEWDAEVAWGEVLPSLRGGGD